MVKVIPELCAYQFIVAHTALTWFVEIVLLQSVVGPWDGQKALVLCSLAEVIPRQRHLVIHAVLLVEGVKGGLGE